MKKIHVLITGIIISQCVAAQVSIGTDASVLRSLTRGQHFTVFGQTVFSNFHIKKKESVYTAVSYYTNGNFRNSLTAFARTPITPLSLKYTVQSSIRFRQFSLGWKHYWKGSFDDENSWNLYTTTGFGLLWGRVQNTYNTFIDTARYVVPQRSLAGSGKIRRLTFDVGTGAEILLGGGLFLYGELRTWLQASDYPTPYLFNDDIPRVLMLNGGIRVLLY
ncbi:MAG: hypothetical protein ICV51_09345 [Flavisolibacter sp.]|nr:hypothetical protein [Flavisolibacter sp.]MBD0366989.1 hypothetical protein [Flavisolibacter sp.]MBD0375819.1 hypothetical protein [Flavisolibacter sp.]